MASAAWGCVFQTTSIDTMRAIKIPLAFISLSLVVGATAKADPLNGIGRFEKIASKCEYTVGDALKHKCRVVQMDRKTETLITVRFIGRGEIRGSSRHLIFVASAQAQTMPLRCSSGRCTLAETTWIATLSSVAVSKFDELGLAEGLPQAWPVKGVCQLSKKKLRCKARANSGEIMTAEVNL